MNENKKELELTKKETIQLLNHYEYERAYNISVASLQNKINKIKEHIKELEHDIQTIMQTARCNKGGGVSMGFVWNLYPNNPEHLEEYQTHKDHMEHLINSKYPIAEKILDILKKETKEYNQDE